MSLFRGIAFPFGRSRVSFPDVVADDDVLEASIRRILRTGVGERVMRSGLGSRIWSLVWENTGLLLRARLRDEVFRALEENEPRVVVDDVTVAEEKTKVTVTVTWHANGREPRDTSEEFRR